MRNAFLLSATILLSGYAIAGEQPRVAVTDLTYEDKVSQYIQFSAGHEKTSVKSSSRERERETDHSYSQSNRDKLDMKSERSYVSSSGYVTYIDRGELRKFTADIKGEMLKSGQFGLVQGKPYVSEKKTEEIFDIIKRIKEGYYRGADYVLFGTVSNIAWLNESNPVQGSDAVSHMLSLELVAEFSLINTKTHEVKAAFSAMGEGQDVKLVKPGAMLKPSRGKVISEVSKSLGADVERQLEEQFALHPSSRSSETTRIEERRSEQVTVYE